MLNPNTWTHVTLWGANSLEETDQIDVSELRAAFRAIPPAIPAERDLDETQTILADLSSRLES